MMAAPFVAFMVIALHGGLCSSDTTPGSLRLVNGSRAEEGRVEIFVNGDWGTVCDDDFDDNDARVVCRQLGFNTSMTRAYSMARFGQGDPRSQIWLNDVRCVGNETRLLDCPASPVGRHNCGHSEDAGVSCAEAVRLVGGSRPTEGRVEIFIQGTWGTVCDDFWDDNDARVVCRQLGFNTSNAEAYSWAEFGQGTGSPVWLDDVECVGNEASLLDCPARPVGSYNCGHHEDAGVSCRAQKDNNGCASQPCHNGGSCSDNGDSFSCSCPLGFSGMTCQDQTPLAAGTVRLVNGSRASEGRVEIVVNGTWGTVCDDGWGADEARVVCRQLGYNTSSAQAYSHARFGQGSEGSPIWMDEIGCYGRESRLLDCSSLRLGTGDCDHSEDAGVDCQAEDDPCETYTVLDDVRRDVRNGGGSLCDNGLSYGWYRFRLNGSDAVMPTSCVSEYHCGTRSPYWLNLRGGQLPARGQQIAASAYAAKYGACSWFRTPINVRNCGSFYIYEMEAPLRCDIAYCAQRVN